MAPQLSVISFHLFPTNSKMKFFVFNGKLRLRKAQFFSALSLQNVVLFLAIAAGYNSIYFYKNAACYCF